METRDDVLGIPLSKRKVRRRSKAALRRAPDAISRCRCLRQHLVSPPFAALGGTMPLLPWLAPLNRRLVAYN